MISDVPSPPSAIVKHSMSARLSRLRIVRAIVSQASKAVSVPLNLSDATKYRIAKNQFEHWKRYHFRRLDPMSIKSRVCHKSSFKLLGLKGSHKPFQKRVSILTRL